MRSGTFALLRVIAEKSTEPSAVENNRPIFNHTLTSGVPIVSRQASIRAMSAISVAMCSSQPASSPAVESKRKRLYLRILCRSSTSPRLKELPDEENPNVRVSSSSVSESDMTSSETSKRFIASAPRSCTVAAARRSHRHLQRLCRDESDLRQPWRPQTLVKWAIS